jgi:GT2 family glycosyltransferase
MDVSIVMVSFNTRRLLDDCIASIERETRCNHEIIIVDNASTDGSTQMVREKYDNVKLIENADNVGFAKANNQGFSVARGKYFFMLNPDTVVLDRAIDKLVDFMDPNEAIGICTPRKIGREGELQRNCDHFPNFWDILWSYTNFNNLFPGIKMFQRSLMRYWNYSEIRDVDRVMGCSLLIRSNLFRQLDGMDEKYFMYFEETDLCYRLKSIGRRIVYFPYAVIMHYHGESAKNATDKTNLIDVTIPDYYYKSKYYFFKKNYSVLSMLLVRALDFIYGSALLTRNVFRSDKNRKEFGIRKGKASLLCSLRS